MTTAPTRGGGVAAMAPTEATGRTAVTVAMAVTVPTAVMAITTAKRRAVHCCSR